MRSEGCLPHFIIGGAPRTGTTFLCQALDRHPDVYLAKPFSPEPKIFMGPPQELAVYHDRYARLFTAARPGQALGEKTTNYFESARCCALIRRTLPEVRLLFIVREPVARAYSNFLWSTKNGLETLSFEEAVRLEGQRPDPLPPGHEHARPFDYVIRGAYDAFAATYYEALGRERVAFFLYEALVSEPARVLRDIQAFIGVPSRALPVDDLGLVNSAREVGPPLAPDLERTLRARLAPAVRRFRALTGLDLGLWGYDAAPS